MRRVLMLGTAALLTALSGCDDTERPTSGTPANPRPTAPAISSPVLDRCADVDVEAISSAIGQTYALKSAIAESGRYGSLRCSYAPVGSTQYDEVVRIGRSVDATDPTILLDSPGSRRIKGVGDDAILTEESDYLRAQPNPDLVKLTLSVRQDDAWWWVAMFGPKTEKEQTASALIAVARTATGSKIAGNYITSAQILADPLADFDPNVSASDARDVLDQAVAPQVFTSYEVEQPRGFTIQTARWLGVSPTSVDVSRVIGPKSVQEYVDYYQQTYGGDLGPFADFEPVDELGDEAQRGSYLYTYEGQFRSRGYLYVMAKDGVILTVSVTRNTDDFEIAARAFASTVYDDGSPLDTQG